VATPFSTRYSYIISRTYNTNGIRISLADMVAGICSLEPFCVLLLDSLPTVNRSTVRYENRVLREERGQSGSIIVIHCFVILYTYRSLQLLECLLKERVFFLSKGRQS